MPASPARSRTSSPPGSTRVPSGRRGRCRMLELAQELLAGEEAWVVGGAVRDEALGRPVVDLDVACRDPRAAALAYGRRSGGAPFPLSDRHGAGEVPPGNGGPAALPPPPAGTG